MPSHLRPGFLQSPNTVTPNPLATPFSRDLPRQHSQPLPALEAADPDSLGWGWNPLIAVQLSGTTTTAQIG